MNNKKEKSFSLSVVILTKNEEKKISRAIKSAQFADEIIVYDCDSQDKTTEIANQMGVRTSIDSIWQGFGKQRNKAQKKAKYDWILMLDADEVISNTLKKNIKKAIRVARPNQVFQFPRISYVFGGFIKHGGWYPDWTTRLYRRQTHSWNNALVHEKLVIQNSDTITKLKGDLFHYPYDNLKHYLNKSAGYAEDWASSKLDDKHRFLVIKSLYHGIFCFIRIYLIRFGFLDGKAGFLLSLLSAHSTFCKYIALWEKQKIIKE